MNGGSPELFEKNSNRIIGKMGIKIHNSTYKNNIADSCYKDTQCWQQDKKNFSNLANILFDHEFDHKKEILDSLISPTDQRVALDMANTAKNFIRYAAIEGDHFDYKLANADHLDALLICFYRITPL